MVDKDAWGDWKPNDVLPGEGPLGYYVRQYQNTKRDLKMQKQEMMTTEELETAAADVMNGFTTGERRAMGMMNRGGMEPVETAESIRNVLEVAGRNMEEAEATLSTIMNGIKYDPSKEAKKEPEVNDMKSQVNYMMGLSEHILVMSQTILQMVLG